MHDFGKICYLDLHKTGSSFVSAFLRECCTLPEKRFAKHQPIRDDFNPTSHYFITVREPLSSYSSLYRYGKQQKGELFNRLRLSGNLHAYNHLDSFVNFLLDSSNSTLLHPSYTSAIADQIGFLSFRFLCLNLAHPELQIRYTLKNDLPLLILKRNFIAQNVLKNENLNSDLRTFVTTKVPNFFDLTKVEVFLGSVRKINTTASGGEQIQQTINAQLTKKVKEKEILLYELY